MSEDSSPQEKEKIFQSYSSLTREAAKGSPELIAWPSSSVPGRIPYDRKLMENLEELARETQSFLLVGAAGYEKFSSKKKGINRAANSAFLFNPDGAIVNRYDKVRLLPFDEYLPLRNSVKFPDWLVNNGLKDYVPGDKLTLFKMGDAAFGVQICWENFFPDNFRKLAAQGIDFMVSMTNEAFTDSPAAHYQMLAMNVFRAVENNIAIVRTAPTGVTCIICPDGRILSTVQDGNANPFDIDGYSLADVALSRERTFYNLYGDVFVWAIAAVLLCFLAAAGMVHVRD